MTIAGGIIALTLINFAFKAAGPALLSDRQPTEKVQAILISLSPALLAGLVVVQLAGPRWDDLDVALLPGLVAAGASFLKGVSEMWCLAIAVAVTVVVRLLVASF
jgi:hypothetical protein